MACAVIALLAACSDDASRPEAATSGGQRPDAVAMDFTERRNECRGCPAGSRLTAVGVVPAVDGIDVEVGFADGPAPDDELWLWFERAAPHPLHLRRVDRGWRITVAEAAPVDADDIELSEGGRGLRIRVRGARAGDGLAVVSGSGDRIPAVGYARGETDGAPAEGALAAEIADAIATVQSGFPGLDADQQVLAQLTIARQLTPGTFRYDLAFADRPDVQLSAEVSVRFPELAQHIYVVRDGAQQLAQSLFVLADGMTLCTWLTDGSAECAPTDVPLPVAGVLGMVADPPSVRVERAGARGVLDQAASCLTVVATTAAGPPEGESCAMTDGALAVNDNLRTGHRLVLIERRDTVADGAFVVP